MKLALLNTAIITTEEGVYRIKTITLEQAKSIVANFDELDSAIGHASTAQIMTTLLGVDVPVNRQLFSQKVGQKALVFKLNGRPEEGKILSIEDIESIKYKWQLLERIE